MKLIACRSSKIEPSFRVEQIRGMFDVPNQTEVSQSWEVNFPIEERDWKIGLIFGPSGAGKTTLSREAFPKAYHHSAFKWPERKSIIDGFDPKTPGKDITAALNSVGFSSPPHWLKPFAHLSNGQKFRTELARCLLMETETVVFDEFTSVVDRDVAKICSAAVAKTIRKRQGPQLVAVSCHSDIIDWLQPDWILDVGANRFEWRCLCRRPEIELKIYETTTAAWAMFRGHHYLSADIHRAAKCYVALWNEIALAFCGVLHFPHPSAKNIKREHRVVVLPDFQGVGIGNAVSEFVANDYSARGFSYRSVTSHPAMIRHRAKSPLWRVAKNLSRETAKGHRSTYKGQFNLTRLTASFEFVGHRKSRASREKESARTAEDLPTSSRAAARETKSTPNV